MTSLTAVSRACALASLISIAIRPMPAPAQHRHGGVTTKPASALALAPRPS